MYNALHANRTSNRLWSAILSVWRALRKWVLGEVSNEDDDVSTGAASSVGLDFLDNTDSNEEMSRQRILDLICEEFEHGMRKLTTKQSLLFPYNYCIFLNPRDFSYFQQTFFKDAEDAARELRERVERLQRRNPRYQSMQPLSNIWQFQFLPFAEGQVLDIDGHDSDELTSLPAGQAKVISTPLIEDITVERPANDGPAVLTLRTPSTTRIRKIIINPEALRDIDVISDYCFRISFERPAAPAAATGLPPAN